MDKVIIYIHILKSEVAETYMTILETIYHDPYNEKFLPWDY